MREEKVGGGGAKEACFGGSGSLREKEVEGDGAKAANNADSGSFEKQPGVRERKYDLNSQGSA